MNLGLGFSPESVLCCSLVKMQMKKCGGPPSMRVRDLSLSFLLKSKFQSFREEYDINHAVNTQPKNRKIRNPGGNHLHHAKKLSNREREREICRMKPHGGLFSTLLVVLGYLRFKGAAGGKRRGAGGSCLSWSWSDHLAAQGMYFFFFCGPPAPVDLGAAGREGGRSALGRVGWRWVGLGWERNDE